MTQLFESHQTARQITVAWQGGEPTLMGLDFYRRSLEVQKKLRRPGVEILNTIQTNGVLLDDHWCAFFKDNGFLVGLSIDGPPHLHDRFRRDKGGRSVFDRVLRAQHLLSKHRVEFNILCTVNTENSQYPLEVYRFFRDQLQAQYIQFIPIVEMDRVTDRSVNPDQYGRFLIEIFDEWSTHDIGKTFVLNIDGALAGWLGVAGTVCIFGPTCGLGLALEHNGDLYSCDHFVSPEYRLGNILETHLGDLVASEQQRNFGLAKRDALPAKCLGCRYRCVCNGECPKNRLYGSGENYLCQGYRMFFEHADETMRKLADLVRQGRPADSYMQKTDSKQRTRTC